ncbi:hypothetical protein LHYA1_G002505 [Lachnellula hyalina]|uniref:BTB domain-containing protein n=1 Tax=Lachnellula hyalina TaxID=1316788 RepID=A0A8H8R634_9HELO|nr:uncharacterized protein LHYA1_G002505 [Lachnellula hyalina]TVY29129.1 hypothetical protein LHYA1_G002505 [Lachnellula hyalina]
MVSQMEVEPSNSLARRGPSSVASSSRHRRGSRQHRSTGYISNEFPEFSHTGDVEILVRAGSRTNRYLLHRLILTQCSGFFEASTSQEWSRASNEGGGELARIGEDSGSEVGRNRDVKKRWRYELDTGTNRDDIPMLVQKENKAVSVFGANDALPPPVRNKPPSSNPSFFRSVANLSLASSHTPQAPPISQEDLDLLNDYDNLFRIFYNYPPALDSIDIATAYIQCKSLLTLADLYDALAVVGPRIDHHLLQFQSRLWKQIAKYPTSYLKLGYLAQSKSVFQEALIHVIGAWPQGERHIRRELPDSVLEIIEDKVEDMADMVGKIEGRLFRLNLTTSRGERVTPQNSYLDWLVVSLFRQWLADSTSPPPPLPPTSARGPPSRNGGGTHGSRSSHSHSQAALTVAPPPNYEASPPTGRTFRTLGSFPANYLSHDECKRFLKLTPELYSRDALKRFEKRMEELRGLAREVVKPLMGCCLLGSAEGVAYLTCTRVEERDFPWLGE